MDNKQDRQFYWEVKDFMSSKKNINEVNKKTSSIVDSVKCVLEQNKPFKQQTVGTNFNTINTVRQAIGYIQNNEKRFKPDCKAFTKNVDTNAFRTLNEGWWDDLVAGAQEVARLGTNIFGSNTPNPPRTTEQAREQAKINRAQSAMRRTDSEIEMERNATGRVASSDDLTAFIERSKDVSGNSTLSPQEQQRARQLQQNLPKSDLPSDLNKNNTNNNSGGSQPVSVGGSQPVSVGDYDPQEHPPADPSSPTPPSSTTTTPATDDELEKRVKARIAGRDRNKQLAMQQGEENVAFLQAKGAPNDPVGRGRHAVALLRAQRRAKGGDGSGLSDEQIRGQEERQLARERRTPEEKAAEKAKNDAALADMNKRAAEMRAEEEARKGKSPVTSTGTKTASSSQTSPQSYRI